MDTKHTQLDDDGKSLGQTEQQADFPTCLPDGAISRCSAFHPGIPSLTSLIGMTLHYTTLENEKKHNFNPATALLH